MIVRHWQQLHQAVRSFSSSASHHAHISHIGKAPVRFPPTVTLTPSPTAVAVQGPLGTTSVPLHPYMRLAFPDPHTLALTVDDASEKKQRAMWGLTRTLIANAVEGMTVGFTVPVHLVGVGYRAALEPDPRGAGAGRGGTRLNMKLGFSHAVYVSVPPHIRAEVPAPTRIVLSCTDKHLLGLFAAQVRKWRPPEPYKGKGIFVGNERVRIKSVKKK
ncbi:ribosomal protein L6 [Amylocystis lapponica]|nr:ribosomal protein L6 [Amylocystis lapponica]